MKVNYFYYINLHNANREGKQMEPYISVLTKNNSLYNLLDTMYYDVLFKQEFDYLLSLNDIQCFAIIWDLNSFEIKKVNRDVAKPIILLSNLPKNFENYLKLHSLNSYKQEINDLIRLNTDTFFSIGRHSVLTNNSNYLLTNLEFRILYYLVKNRGETISSNFLMDKLELNSHSSLYVGIKKLRQKLEKNPSEPTLLMYHKNHGYYLNFSNINES